DTAAAEPTNSVRSVGVSAIVTGYVVEPDELEPSAPIEITVPLIGAAVPSGVTVACCPTFRARRSISPTVVVTWSVPGPPIPVERPPLLVPALLVPFDAEPAADEPALCWAAAAWPSAVFSAASAPASDFSSAAVRVWSSSTRWVSAAHADHWVEPAPWIVVVTGGVVVVVGSVVVVVSGELAVIGSAAGAAFALP